MRVFTKEEVRSRTFFGFNLTGNPALAKGGSGDVLSGIVGAALARRQSRTAEPRSESRTAGSEGVRVAAAVHLHGLAGDFARDMLHENSVLAGNLPEYLGEAFHDCEQQISQGLLYLQK